MLKHLSVILIFASLLDSSAHAEATPPHGKPTPAGVIPTSINLTFDGQCDGLAITIDPSTSLAHATRTGCLTGDLSGTLGIIVDASSSHAISSIGEEISTTQNEVITLAEDYTDAEAANNNMTVINTNGSFIVYHIPDLQVVTVGTFSTGGSGGHGSHGGR